MTDLDVANAMADAARSVTLRYFRSKEFQTENKDKRGFDPVTQADREAETAMRAVLAEMRPEDSILGEEHGALAGKSGRRWVLDPIDGTRAFIAGLPTWGTLIGLEEGTETLLGMVDQPYIGERYSGHEGKAWFQRGQEAQAITVRAERSLDQAILFTTFPEVGSPAERAAFEHVSAKVKLTRYGTDCYAYALLAAGHIDLVIEAGLNNYDILGPKGVIEAAGGIVTCWDGSDASGGGQIIAAGSAELHEEACAILQASGAASLEK